MRVYVLNNIKPFKNKKHETKHTKTWKNYF